MELVPYFVTPVQFLLSPLLSAIFLYLFSIWRSPNLLCFKHLSYSSWAAGKIRQLSQTSHEGPTMTWHVAGWLFPLPRHPCYTFSHRNHLTLPPQLSLSAGNLTQISQRKHKPFISLTFPPPSLKAPVFALLLSKIHPSSRACIPPQAHKAYAAFTYFPSQHHLSVLSTGSSLQSK